MKIAFIFPRFSGPYGGERLLLSLARELLNQDHEVTIYTSARTENVDEIKPVGVTFVNTDRLNFGGHQVKNLLDFFKMPFAAYKIRKDYDYIVGMGWQTAFCLYNLRLLRHFDKQKLAYYCLEPPRFLYDLRHEQAQKGIKRLVLSPLFSLIRFLDIKSVKRIPHAMAISEWTADQLQQIYGKTAPIIYPGVEIERFKGKSKAAARKRLSLQPKSMIYLSVSKLHPRKRIDQSIDVYLKRKDSSSQYFIIGDGPDRSNIEAYIERSGSKSIHLLGQLSDNEVTDYMVAADYFIFTAINEPFGIAPLEAQVAGCAILPHPFERKILDWHGISKQFIDTLKTLNN